MADRIHTPGFFQNLFLSLIIVFFQLIIVLVCNHLGLGRLLHLFSRTKSEAFTMVNCSVWPSECPEEVAIGQDPFCPDVLCIWVSHLVEWGWEWVTGKQSFPESRRLAEVCSTCQSYQQGTAFCVLPHRFQPLCSFYLFCLLLSACSAALVRTSSPPWTTWIPLPASTSPHALTHAGCQPSQMRILTHSRHLNWKQQCKSDQKESGDCLTTRQGFNHWWILAAISSVFEVLEFSPLTVHFLADILFIVIAVVSFGIGSFLQSRDERLCWKSYFCIFVGDSHSCATR